MRVCPSLKTKAIDQAVDVKMDRSALQLSPNVPYEY
jgi:hypothetical protein